MTFNQIKTLKGTIKKGAKSEIVVFWSKAENKNQNAEKKLVQLITELYILNKEQNWSHGGVIFLMNYKKNSCKAPFFQGWQLGTQTSIFSKEKNTCKYFEKTFWVFQSKSPKNFKNFFDFLLQDWKH